MSGGEIPALLAESTTILLYKKNDPRDLGNYRPIGLANTLCKLWTKLLAAVVSGYAERNHILSSGQAGFRAGYYTHLQTQALTSALEDARSTQRDIFMLQVDFTNAFNRVNHRKLMRVMRDLGFPPTLVDLVAAVYKNSTTDIQTPHGSTPRMSINRGTIQGDSLSPVLFAIYLEPLLRWLQIGESGYVITGMENNTSLGNMAYADDLAILSPSLDHIRTQARKVTAYSDWADLTINTDKSFVSGVLYGTLSKVGPSGNQGLQATSRHVERKVRLGHTWAKYSPPTQPFEYLGVWMTMTLDWAEHKRRALAKCKHICGAIRASRLHTQQKLHTLDRWIIRKVAYGFPTVPYSPTDIQALDTALNAVVKAAYGLPAGMPTSLLRAEPELFGLGRPSMAALYAQENVKHLVWALNHPSKLGPITETILQRQLKEVSILGNPTYQDMKYQSWARQAHYLLQSHNMCLTTNGAIRPLEHATAAHLFTSVLRADTATRLAATDMPTRLLRPLWDLTGDPRQLVKGTRVVEEQTLRLMYGDKLRPKHIQSYRILTHLICTGGIGGIDLATEKWTDHTTRPLTGQQLQIRPGMLAAIQSSYMGQPPSSQGPDIRASLSQSQPATNHPPPPPPPPPTQSAPPAPSP